MLENQIARSTRNLRLIYFGVGFTFSYLFGRALWNEKYKYRAYVLYPDNMKKIDALRAWVLRWYDYYDKRFDLPKELSFASLIRFVISMKRVKRAEKKKEMREHLDVIIEDAKASDAKVESIIRKIKGKQETNDLASSANEGQ